MRTLKLLIVALAVMLGAESVSAGETATLTKRRRGSTASILPGYWHRNFKEAKAFGRGAGTAVILTLFDPLGNLIIGKGVSEYKGKM